MSRRFCTFAAVVSLAALFAPGAARAGDGDPVLLKLDDATNRAGDFQASVKAVTVIPGRSPLEMAFRLQVKGPRRLVDFEAPGDMKGTRVLVLDRTQMYVYLPAYNKVRRVASHVNNQGFMGTMFADADMATSRYAEAYEAKLLNETAEVWNIALTPKPGAEVAYPKLELTVRKSDSLPNEVRYFNAKGEKIKTETRSDYACKGDICIPGTLKMVDHTKGDAHTTLTQTVQGINTGLSEDLFSQRNLQRGP